MTDPSTTEGSSQESLRLRIYLSFALYLLLLQALLFLAAGRVDWWRAWLYLVLSFTATVLSRWAAARKHLDLLAERSGYRDRSGVMRGDRAFVAIVGIYDPLATMVVSALEDRFLQSRSSGYSHFCRQTHYRLIPGLW